MSNSREKFEIWFLKEAKWYGNKDCLDFDGDEYTDGNVQLAFDAWKASREAVVVELPEHHPMANTAGDMARGIREATKVFKAAIEAQGLKVTP